MTSRAGFQRAAQESFCVRVPPHDGQPGVVRCGDSLDRPPRRLSVVRPGEVVTIRVGSATAIRGARAYVKVLGRDTFFGSFRLTQPVTRLRVNLRPRAYEVEIFANYEMADGRTGDTTASLGILVDRKRPLRLLPLSAANRPAAPELTGRAAN